MREELKLFIDSKGDYLNLLMYVIFLVEKRNPLLLCWSWYIFLNKVLVTLVRSWDHHDILSVLPEYNSSSKCSTGARLQSIAPYGGRKETAVYAADVQTGIVIRCKVFIDNISRIQIFHNSIKLDLDGLATLRIRAFDSEGNREFLLYIYWDFCTFYL